MPPKVDEARVAMLAHLVRHALGQPKTPEGHRLDWSLATPANPRLWGGMHLVYSHGQKP
jgi:hypothetical protein